jgi:thermostable 8-oxoguanine DNA glycosylase
VDTYTPLEWVESYSEGIFSLARLSREELCIKVLRKREDYEKNSSIYIVPLAEKDVGRERRILEASKVCVKTSRDYLIWKVEGVSVEANVVLPRGEAL